MSKGGNLKGGRTNPNVNFGSLNEKLQGDALIVGAENDAEAPAMAYSLNDGRP